MEGSENNIIIRICPLAKLARSTVYRIITAGVVTDHGVKRKQVQEKYKNIDDACKHDICRIIFNFYKDNIVSTLPLIKTKLQDYPDYKFSTPETLRLLSQCGLVWLSV